MTALRLTVLRLTVLHPILFSVMATLALTSCHSDDEDNPPPEPVTTGLQSMMSNGEERSYYVLMPEDNIGGLAFEPLFSIPSSAHKDEPAPLIIGFHGSFASHYSWVGEGLPDFEGRRYDFIDAVGQGAIMVFPDALPLGEPPDQQINWNFEYDFLFFEDLLVELERRGVKYDPNRVFVVGHSSGAGMSSEIGCRYGDIVRGAAISSGSLISGGSCVGSVGIIQTQGELDQAVPLNVGAFARNFWVLYNGHDLESTIDGIVEQCVDYANVAF
ncbi:MAG: alpha/beta fold hydrolase, partial [Gammaproteobacteria bacterium]